MQAKHDFDFDFSDLSREAGGAPARSAGNRAHRDYASVVPNVLRKPRAASGDVSPPPVRTTDLIRSPDQLGVADYCNAIAGAFAGTPKQLPAADRIGACLGADVSGVEMYTGPAAAAACDAINAHGFARGNRVAFADPNPSLHLQAHEAAHTIQQGTAGVQRKGRGASDVGSLQREADAAADAVVAGRSMQIRGAGAAAARPLLKSKGPMSNSSLQLKIGHLRRVLQVKGKPDEVRLRNDSHFVLDGGTRGKMTIHTPVWVEHGGEAVCHWICTTYLEIEADATGKLSYTQMSQAPRQVFGGNMTVSCKVAMHDPPRMFVNARGDVASFGSSESNSSSSEFGFQYGIDIKGGTQSTTGSNKSTTGQPNFVGSSMPLGIRGRAAPPKQVLEAQGHTVKYERDRQTRMSGAEYTKLKDWWYALPKQIRADVSEGRRVLRVVGHASPPGSARRLNKGLSRKRRDDVLAFFEGRLANGNVSGLYVGEHEAKTRSVIVSIGDAK